MATNSNIEWTDATWNPVLGCSIVSAGCKNCYAMRMAYRLEAMGQPAYRGLTQRVNGKAVWTGDIATDGDKLDLPLTWRKPRRVFVNSMSDLFHESVPFDFIRQVFSRMWRANQHTYQVLTKRPARMVEFWQWLVAQGLSGVFPPRIPSYIHIGASVENQAAADERTPPLRQIPARVRWLSIEPLLGPIDISPHIQALNWIVVGGESGPGARPMHPAWPRSLRDQCQDAGVPFFFKQWGEWAPVSPDTPIPLDKAHPQRLCAMRDNGTTLAGDDAIDQAAGWMWRAGKRKAGRLLDGREWNEYPRI